MANTYKNDPQTKKKLRNRFFIVVILILLVAITSIFTGTLSKYIMTDEVSDEGAVAKFGLNLPNSINLFKDSYTNVSADETGKKIIAPGTEGFYAFNVEGSSEVAYVVSADISVTYSDEWEGYTPLLFSIDGDDWTSLEDFETNLSELLASTTIEPNAIYASTAKIYWQWPFTTTQENDKKDTKLGNLATTANVPTVTVDLVITAEQVD